MKPEEIDQAVWEVASGLLDSQASWMFTGSVAAALHGVPVRCHDVDVECDAQGAYLIQDLLGGTVLRPVSFSAAEHVRSHFGRTRLGPAIVEIMGGLEIRLESGTWLSPAPVADRRVFEPFRDLRVPVAARPELALFYRRMGRPDKARQVDGE
ncbi:nucleotidyltransferase domain-containing protein [Streptomyces sp. NPDC051913]|uniref:nucleotidyltransferase domain-containing protein n=1 Tax=Streptomyces sp. NPDC051913 TaxID=3365676 RepID=UPI0037D86F17